MRTPTLTPVLAALTLLFTASWSPVAEASCDARQLRRDLTEASPVSVPRVFLKLAECDEKAAKAAANDAMARVLPGDEGNQAAVAAVKVGADAAVARWIGTLQADQRSATIDHLGRRCADEPAVATFFADARDREGDRFWTDRWYRGLSDCRTERIQALLTEAVESGTTGGSSEARAQYFGILEVYGRNLRGAAIPRLEALVGELSDDKERRLVISAFADAAAVGHPDGLDPEAAELAAQAIERLGPTLAGETVERARDTLRALGATDTASRFVRHRWPDRLADGGYTYLAAATEIVTCKNGKKQGYLHTGRVVEGASRWPDELELDLEERLRSAWRLQAAEKCKGTGQVRVVTTEAPVSGDDAAWLDAQREAFRDEVKGFHKSAEQAHDPVRL